MIKRLKNLIEAEYDQDLQFITVVRTILIIFTIAVMGRTISIAVVDRTEFDFIGNGLVIAVGILTLLCLALTYRGILWPGKLLPPLALLFIAPTIAIRGFGIHHTTIVMFPVMIFVTGLLLGQRLIAWALFFSIIGILAVGIFDIIGLNQSSIATQTSITDIVVLIIGQMIAAGSAYGLMTRLNHALLTSRTNEQAQIQANQELRSLQTSLEQRVNERTNELEAANRRNEQRAEQFEAIAQVIRAIVSIRSLVELLPKITKLISEHFHFYHVGVFLNDPENQYATLSAANSEGGQRMLARKHQLKIGEQGIVGVVASTGEPRIALDVGDDAVFFNNPDLPETHSEMALPLKISGKVIGVLDVQSKKAGAFDEDDLQVLEILADQVSLAIENANLFEESSKSLAEAETLYRQYLRQAWRRLPKELALSGYRYTTTGTVPVKNTLETKPESASTEYDQPHINVPISLRGEEIGSLVVQVPDPNKLGQDQLDLIKAVADRVAISAENARLFEETNRRAERERLVADITTKIRSTNDPQTMIQIALDELKSSLGATQVELIPQSVGGVNGDARGVTSSSALVSESDQNSGKNGRQG